MSQKIKVAILEDHQSITDGYLYRLDESKDIQVVGAAAFGEDLDPMLAGQPWTCWSWTSTSPRGPIT